MKKLKNSAGMTLLEMLCALSILVILIGGMGAVMNSGTAIYQEAIFEADSAALADILNTALGDILRYSEEIRINGVYDGDGDGKPDPFLAFDGSVLEKEKAAFVFTNGEYGFRNAYFQISDTSGGVLQLRNMGSDHSFDLVNAGAYPGLIITDLAVVYIPSGAEGLRGGCFTVSYVIRSEKHGDFARQVETVIRLIND